MLLARSGIWASMPEVIARAPQGWKNEHLDNMDTKVETEKEIVIYPYLRRRDALHAEGTR